MQKKITRQLRVVADFLREKRKPARTFRRRCVRVTFAISFICRAHLKRRALWIVRMSQTPPVLTAIPVPFLRVAHDRCLLFNLGDKNRDDFRRIDERESVLKQREPKKMCASSGDFPLFFHEKSEHFW